MLERFEVAVVDPEFGTNLGYIARTMANFGLRNLIVVSRDGELDSIRLAQAKLFSAHARPIIEKIDYVRSLEDLRSRFQIMIGTTAIEARRKSNLTRRTLDVQECVEMIAGRVFSGKIQGCFVFGRDTTGLTNRELASCDYNLTIRTGSSYNTLNVSHAAAIIFYVFASEFRKLESSQGRLRNSRPNKKYSSPSRRERDRAIMLFEKLADEAEFQRFKSGLLKEALNRMFNRGDPSLREIYLLMGLASKASSKIRRLSSGPP